MQLQCSSSIWQECMTEAGCALVFLCSCALYQSLGKGQVRSSSSTKVSYCLIKENASKKVENSVYVSPTEPSNTFLSHCQQNSTSKIKANRRKVTFPDSVYDTEMQGVWALCTHMLSLPLRGKESFSWLIFVGLLQDRTCQLSAFLQQYLSLATELHFSYCSTEQPTSNSVTSIITRTEIPATRENKPLLPHLRSFGDWSW